MASIDNPLSLLREDSESPVSDLLDRVRGSLEEKRLYDAVQYCQQAKRTDNEMQADICDRAHVRAHEAYIRHRLGQESEALNTAEQALRRFSYSGEKHNKVTAYILRALIAYEAGAFEKAQTAYEDCHQCLERLRKDALDSADKKQAEEYKELLQQVKERLEQIAQSIENSDRALAPSFQKPWISADALYFVPVIGPIPAGQSKVSTDDIEQYVAISGNHVIINDRKYRFKSFHSSQSSVVKLNPEGYDYYLSEVIGYSMNEAGINDGDYVLLRRPETGTIDPRPQDIVAAAIQGIDNEVTLKRYIEKEDKVILRPESTDSSYEPYEFKKGNQEKDNKVTIVAVAIATLKSVDSYTQ